LSHNFKIVHNMFKNPKVTPHFIGHGFPYVFHCSYHYIIWIRLTAMDYCVFLKDSNVICEVHTEYVQHDVLEFHNYLKLVQKPWNKSPLIWTWLSICISLQLHLIICLRLTVMDYCVIIKNFSEVHIGDVQHHVS